MVETSSYTDSRIRAITLIPHHQQLSARVRRVRIIQIPGSAQSFVPRSLATCHLRSCSVSDDGDNIARCRWKCLHVASILSHAEGYLYECFARSVIQQMPSYLGIEGYHAFVTGARGGIGRAIVKELVGMSCTQSRRELEYM